MPDANQEMKIICVACPRGCQLRVSRQGETLLVSQHGCKRGIEYAQQEVNDPRRMVATTVRLQGGVHPLLPVYTTSPFPKGQIRTLLKELRKISLSAPIKTGTIVLKDALGTGIDILASRDM
jgi:CxxC motif-containing protein